MISLRAEEIGKKYQKQWLFRKLSFEIAAGEAVAIVGRNGAGKSTLLKILAGHTTPTDGRISTAPVYDSDDFYRALSWNAPAVELYGAFTVAEAFAFHFRLKECVFADSADALRAVELYAHRDKPLKALSSGMLQKAKFALALFSQAELLLFDEPTAFMDAVNAELCLRLLDEYRSGRTLLLASNLPREYKTADRTLDIDAYAPSF